MSSSSQMNHPSSFKAAQWTQENAQQLEIRDVEWRSPRHGEVVIRVHAAGLNSTDNIARYNLIGSVKYPTTPGSNVVGQVVQVGQGVKHVKEGQHVVAILSHKGLAEYAVAHEMSVCPLSDQQKSREDVVVQAFDGARIEESVRRYERELQHEDEQRYREINRRLGFEGEGCCVVYGEGGLARMAIEVLRRCESRMMKSSKIVLVALSSRWPA
ncbi:hypothetical protein JCM10212_004867, partial [Sporobolomyces blumeae]